MFTNYSPLVIFIKNIKNALESIEKVEEKFLKNISKIYIFVFKKYDYIKKIYNILKNK